MRFRSLRSARSFFLPSSQRRRRCRERADPRGTNQFHGNLFEFLRNSTPWDSNDFFNNANAPKPEFRQNQYGGTFGIRIKRDRLFFFTGLPGFAHGARDSFVASVATVAERSGVISAALKLVIYDPSTTASVLPPPSTPARPFRNMIPANRIDPLAAHFLNFFPCPTQSGSDRLNLINDPIWSRGGDQGDVRIDYNLGSKGSLFGRYSNDHANQDFPNDLTTSINPFGGNSRGNMIDLSAQNAGIDLTYLATPAVVLEGRLGFSRFNFQGQPLGANLPQVSGVCLSRESAPERLRRPPESLPACRITPCRPPSNMSSIRPTRADGTASRLASTSAVYGINNFFVSTPSGIFDFASGTTSQTVCAWIRLPPRPAGFDRTRLHRGRRGTEKHR